MVIEKLGMFLSFLLQYKSLHLFYYLKKIVQDLTAIVV